MQKIDDYTQYRKELKQKILVTAMREFKQKGIRKVRMDDIANLLTISKRTLYEVYANKEELLFEGIKKEEAEKDNYMNSFMERKEFSVMDVVIEYYNFQLKNIAEINPLFFSELHRYSRVVQYLSKKRESRDCITQELIQRGIEEGYFSGLFDYTIIMKVMNTAIEGLFSKKIYNEYDVQTLYKNINSFFLRGFCTIRGIERIDQLMISQR